MFPRKEETKTNKRQHADRATLGRCAERYVNGVKNGSR